MKVTSMNCPNCNSPLQVKEGQKTTTCEYCGSHLGIDDGTLKLDVSLTNGEEAGYQFEKGRQRAQAEQGSYTVVTQVKAQPAKKRRTWLWILGWIFCFPVPLTVLMLRSPLTKNIDIRIRVGIVVAVWAILFIVSNLCKSN